MPEPFLAILSHSPSDFLCRSSSHAAHASRDANGTMGRSGLVVIASPFWHRETPAEVYRVRLLLPSTVSVGNPRNRAQPQPFFMLYSPECVATGFCEVQIQ